MANNNVFSLFLYYLKIADRNDSWNDDNDAAPIYHPINLMDMSFI